MCLFLAFIVFSFNSDVIVFVIVFRTADFRSSYLSRSNNEKNVSQIFINVDAEVTNSTGTQNESTDIIFLKTKKCEYHF